MRPSTDTTKEIHMDTMTPEQHTPVDAFDSEMAALTETNERLSSLPDDARARVLAYLNARHGAPRTPRAASTSRRRGA
jgi:hypothetical protein